MLANFRRFGLGSFFGGTLGILGGISSPVWADTIEVNRTVPDLGVMLNSDGEDFFIGRQSYYGRTATQMLDDIADMVDELADTEEIKSFMLSVAFGSENTYFKTELAGGSTIGWQYGPFDPNDSGTFGDGSVVNYARAFLAVTPSAAGQNPWYTAPTDPMDPVYKIAQLVKAKGIGFFPSVRMGDAHFAGAPWNDAGSAPAGVYSGSLPETTPGQGNWEATTGRFWVDHNGNPGGETLAIMDNNRFDYAQAVTREYRKDMIHEVLERYSGKLAGIELDFTRHGIFFDAYNNATNKAWMTEIVKEVRQHLDDLETRSGSTPESPKHKYLIVRVPPALYNAQYTNLDVASWLEEHDVVQRRWNHYTPWSEPVTLSPQKIWRERLVDVIIPAQTYALASDMPIEDYVDEANAAGAKVYPCIYERAQSSWRFRPSPVLADYASNKVNRRPTPELIAGAASNYRAMGAAGFQMYNFTLPLSEEFRAGESEGPPYLGETIPPLLLSAAALEGKNRVYEITPAASPTSDIYKASTYPNYNTISYQKQMPRLLVHEQVESMKLYVGEDLASAANLDYVGLRLGLAASSLQSGVYKPDYSAQVDPQGASLIVKVNGIAVGNTVYNGPIATNLLATSSDAPGSPAPASGYPSIPRAYVQFSVPPALLIQGENVIDIMVSGNTVPFSLVELQLGVFYED